MKRPFWAVFTGRMALTMVPQGIALWAIFWHVWSCLTPVGSKWPECAKMGQNGQNRGFGPFLDPQIGPLLGPFWVCRRVSVPRNMPLGGPLGHDIPVLGAPCCLDLVLDRFGPPKWSKNGCFYPFLDHISCPVRIWSGLDHFVKSVGTFARASRVAPADGPEMVHVWGPKRGQNDPFLGP